MNRSVPGRRFCSRNFVFLLSFERGTVLKGRRQNFAASRPKAVAGTFMNPVQSALQGRLDWVHECPRYCLRPACCKILTPTLQNGTSFKRKEKDEITGAKPPSRYGPIHRCSG